MQIHSDKIKPRHFALHLYFAGDLRHNPLPPQTTGEKYSGKFLLCPGKKLHKSLAIRALQAEESLNSFCLNTLKKALVHYNDSANF